MKKIDIYYELEQDEKEQIKNLAYDMICNDMQRMFPFYDIQIIKEKYIVLAMEIIERKNMQKFITNKEGCKYD